MRFLTRTVGVVSKTSAPRLFGASDLARWTGSDPSAVHKWVKSGAIVAGRTPGGHLRFSEEAVREFLSRHGFTIPEELCNANNEQAIKEEP